MNIGACDIDNMVAFAKDNAIDFCVVAPDDPLAAGMVDAMNGRISPASAQQGRRPDRRQQGVCQKPDEEVRHPHRRL